MGVVVFHTDPELTFAVGLARWFSGQLDTVAEPATAAAGEEPAAEVVSELEKECKALEAAGSFAKLSEKLSAGIKARFGTASDAEVESSYAIYLQLLVKWELLASNIEALADEVVSSEERPQLRRSLLVSMYSLVQQFGLEKLRFSVLLRLIRYASATQQLDSVFGKPAGAVRTASRPQPPPIRI